MLFAPRFLNRHVARMGKQRIKYWAGGQTEGYVAWMLQQDLSDDWWIFNGVELQTGWDIDHIAVGPGGLFAISTKNCRGCFTLGTGDAEGKILLNGQVTPHVPQAFGQALELRTRLEALLGADVPFVQAVLAAPFGYVVYPEKTQRVWVLHQDNLTDALQAEEAKKRLSKDDIARCVKVMEMLKIKGKEIWKRPSSSQAKEANKVSA